MANRDFPVSDYSRRDFVRNAVAVACLNAAASSSGLLPSALAAEGQSSTAGKALIGSNVYGWTQYAQRDKKPFDINQVISVLADLGYDYLESFMDVDKPDNNGKLAEQFKAKGLKAISIYTGARIHEAANAYNNVAKVLAAAKVCQQAGFKVISCNPDPIGREKTDEELKMQVSALSELGLGLKEFGMQLAIHHHMPEMANKAREFHYNFRNSKPDVVGFCYDVHWVWKGGVMPMDALKEYADRVATWHLRQSRDGIWWEDLDTGDIDYDAVAKYAKEHGLPRRFTVELALEGGTKITRSAAENHRRSREFVRKVFGA